MEGTCERQGPKLEFLRVRRRKERLVVPRTEKTALLLLNLSQEVFLPSVMSTLIKESM